MGNLDGKDLEKVAGGSKISEYDARISLTDRSLNTPFKDLIGLLKDERGILLDRPLSSLTARDELILQWIEHNFSTDDYREHKAEIRNSLSDGGKKAFDKYAEWLGWEI